jgi:hypothetical protein
MTKPLTEREIDALILQANAEWDRDNRASATAFEPIPGAAVRLVRLVEARREDTPNKDRLTVALRAIMRLADQCKEPCGQDPESAAAVRNGKFATIAQMAAQGLGLVRGPAFAAAPVQPAPQRQRPIHAALSEHAKRSAAEAVAAEAQTQRQEDASEFFAVSSDCPDGVLPDGPMCPLCGGKRGPSGVDGGSWVHIRAAAPSPQAQAQQAQGLTEREAFEAWALSEEGGWWPEAVARVGDGYHAGAVTKQWTGWKARAARELRASTAAAPPPVPAGESR